MSARPFQATDATAFHLAALLEQYEHDVEQLASARLDADLYAQVSRDLGEMRLVCAGLPRLSVPWVQVLISNAELMHCLWAASAASGASHSVECCKAEHLVAVRALREKCLSQFTRVERRA